MSDRRNYSFLTLRPDSQLPTAGPYYPEINAGLMTLVDVPNANRFELTAGLAHVVDTGVGHVARVGERTKGKIADGLAHLADE